MTQGKGKSPGTQRALAAANLKRKLNRIKNDLATISREDSDRLLAQSPAILKTIYFLQEMKEDKTAIELVEELQTLLVEQAYVEAKSEEVIKVGDAYIV